MIAVVTTVLVASPVGLPRGGPVGTALVVGALPVCLAGPWLPGSPVADVCAAGTD